MRHILTRAVGPRLAITVSGRTEQMAITDQLAVSNTISPAQHAVLDYGVAATFFALGMRYRNRHPAASMLAFINGGMVLGMSMHTDYPGGVSTPISSKTHGTMDAV